MACNLPLPAWQVHGEGGGIIIGLKKPISEAERLLLPCGKCHGCRTAAARAWALRCHLELQQHTKAAFITLTYDDRWLPPTLVKRDLQLFLKRLRKDLGANRPVRYFASGEYGEQRQRPHYHALLYGAGEEDRQAVSKAWGLGRTGCDPMTPQRIAYCAGYTQKKLGDSQHARHERVDPDTGEVYRWQPPFIQMSRRPGIGGDARKYQQSWREYAVHNGVKMPVPRFLHEAWKKTATETEIAENRAEKKARAEARNITLQMLTANEAIAISRQAISDAKRHRR